MTRRLTPVQVAVLLEVTSRPDAGRSYTTSGTARRGMVNRLVPLCHGAMVDGRYQYVLTDEGVRALECAGIHAETIAKLKHARDADR